MPVGLKKMSAFILIAFIAYDANNLSGKEKRPNHTAAALCVPCMMCLASQALAERETHEKAAHIHSTL